MADHQKNKSEKEQSGEMREQAKINDKAPGRNKTEESEIEQTRIEYRRDADLEDKTPAGDGGPEDANTNDINMEGASDY